MTISRELNQSLSCPRSSIICRQPDTDRQCRESAPVEAQLRTRSAGRHEQREAADCGDPERHVHVEHPAPVICIGEVAAERRADDRPQHHAHAEDRHRLRALLERVDVEHRRLRKRHEGGAAHPLQQPEDDHLRQRLRGAAHHRGDGEAEQAGDEEVLAPEACRHPANRRGHDRGRDDVGGQHPGDLVGGRREASLHVGERDVRDGRVERLHQRCGHRAAGDQGPVRHLCGRLGPGRRTGPGGAGGHRVRCLLVVLSAAMVGRFETAGKAGSRRSAHSASPGPIMRDAKAGAPLALGFSLTDSGARPRTGGFHPWPTAIS